MGCVNCKRKQEMPENTKATFGTAKRFECKVVGSPRPTVTWWKDGVNISNSERYQFEYSEDGDITMEIEKVTNPDKGYYQCRAENSEGWAVTAAYLNVRATTGKKEEENVSIHRMSFEEGGCHVKNLEKDCTQGEMTSKYQNFIQQVTDRFHDEIIEKEDMENFQRMLEAKIEGYKSLGDDSGLEQESNSSTEAEEKNLAKTRKKFNEFAMGVSTDSNIESQDGLDDPDFESYIETKAYFQRQGSPPIFLNKDALDEFKQFHNSEAGSYKSENLNSPTLLEQVNNSLMGHKLLTLLADKCFDSNYTQEKTLGSEKPKHTEKISKFLEIVDNHTNCIVKPEDYDNQEKKLFENCFDYVDIAPHIQKQIYTNDQRPSPCNELSWDQKIFLQNPGIQDNQECFSDVAENGFIQTDTSYDNNEHKIDGQVKYVKKGKEQVNSNSSLHANTECENNDKTVPKCINNPEYPFDCKRSRVNKQSQCQAQLNAETENIDLNARFSQIDNGEVSVEFVEMIGFESEAYAVESTYRSTATNSQIVIMQQPEIVEHDISNKTDVLKEENKHLLYDNYASPSNTFISPIYDSSNDNMICLKVQNNYCNSEDHVTSGQNMKQEHAHNTSIKDKNPTMKHAEKQSVNECGQHKSSEDQIIYRQFESRPNFSDNERKNSLDIDEIILQPTNGKAVAKLKELDTCKINHDTKPKEKSFPSNDRPTDTPNENQIFKSVMPEQGHLVSEGKQNAFRSCEVKDYLSTGKRMSRRPTGDSGIGDEDWTGDLTDEEGDQCKKNGKLHSRPSLSFQEETFLQLPVITEKDCDHIENQLSSQRIVKEENVNSDNTKTIIEDTLNMDRKFSDVPVTIEQSTKMTTSQVLQTNHFTSKDMSFSQIEESSTQYFYKKTNCPQTRDYTCKHLDDCQNMKQNTNDNSSDKDINKNSSEEQKDMQDDSTPFTNSQCTTSDDTVPPNLMLKRDIGNLIKATLEQECNSTDGTHSEEENLEIDIFDSIFQKAHQVVNEQYLPCNSKNEEMPSQSTAEYISSEEDLESTVYPASSCKDADFDYLSDEKSHQFPLLQTKCKSKLDGYSSDSERSDMSSQEKSFLKNYHPLQRAEKKKGNRKSATKRIDINNKISSSDSDNEHKGNKKSKRKNLGPQKKSFKEDSDQSLKSDKVQENFVDLSNSGEIDTKPKEYLMCSEATVVCLSDDFASIESKNENVGKSNEDRQSILLLTNFESCPATQDPVNTSGQNQVNENLSLKNSYFGNSLSDPDVNKPLRNEGTLFPKDIPSGERTFEDKSRSFQDSNKERKNEQSNQITNWNGHYDESNPNTPLGNINGDDKNKKDEDDSDDKKYNGKDSESDSDSSVVFDVFGSSDEEIICIPRNLQRTRCGLKGASEELVACVKEISTEWVLPNNDCSDNASALQNIPDTIPELTNTYFTGCATNHLVRFEDIESYSDELQYRHRRSKWIKKSKCHKNKLHSVESMDEENLAFKYFEILCHVDEIRESVETMCVKSLLTGEVGVFTEYSMNENQNQLPLKENTVDTEIQSNDNQNPLPLKSYAADSNCETSAEISIQSAKVSDTYIFQYDSENILPGFESANLQSTKPLNSVFYYADELSLKPQSFHEIEYQIEPANCHALHILSDVSPDTDKTLIPQVDVDFVESMHIPYKEKQEKDTNESKSDELNESRPDNTKDQPIPPSIIIDEVDDEVSETDSFIDDVQNGNIIEVETCVQEKQKPCNKPPSTLENSSPKNDNDEEAEFSFSLDNHVNESDNNLHIEFDSTVEDNETEKKIVMSESAYDEFIQPIKAPKTDTKIQGEPYKLIDVPSEEKERIYEDQQDSKSEEETEQRGEMGDDGYRPAIIVKTSPDVSLEEGTNLNIKWQVAGLPTPRIKVLKDGMPLQLFDGMSLQQTNQTWVLSIPDITRDDAGIYELIATNKTGSDKSSVTVDVTRPSMRTPTMSKNPYPPEFMSAPGDTQITKGDDLILRCTVQGHPMPSIQWWNEGEELTNSQEVEIIEEKEGQCMVIWEAGLQHAGRYTCRAVNSSGMAEVRVNVKVNKEAPRYSLAGDEIIPEVDVSKLLESLQIGDYQEPSDTIPVPEQTPYDTPLYDNIDGLTPPTRRKLADGGYEQLGDLKEQEVVVETTRNLNLECGLFLPAVELELDNTTEIPCKKYCVITDYHDNTNNVWLVTGDLIHVLKKASKSHWLVQKADDKEEVCYVPVTLLQPIDDTDGANDFGNNDAKRQAHKNARKAVSDLVDMEADYICDLRDLIENYYDPISQGYVEVKDGVEFPEDLVARQHQVFGNLEDLYQFHHKDLLPALISCADSEQVSDIAEAFLSRRESFQQYGPYWLGRDVAEECLNEEEIQRFLQSYGTLIGDTDMNLEDLLNRPVERIHEYIDLMKNLIKYTSKSGGDVTQLMSALSMLIELCEEVDNIMLLSNIQGYHGDVNELGPVLRHETVQICKDGESPVPGEIFVFPDTVLVTTATAQEEGKQLHLEKALSLRDTIIFQDGAPDCCRIDFLEVFAPSSRDLEGSGPTLTLQSRSPFAKQRLVRDLREAQIKLGVDKELQDKMPEKRKIKTSKSKMVSSTPRKKVVRPEDVEREEQDRHAEDLSILEPGSEDTVYPTPEFEDGTSRPMFKKKLEKTVVEEGATAQLECACAGIPPPKVLWMKNNRPLMATDRCRVIVDGERNILEFPRARPEDTGVYSARAMNVNGSTVSTAELHVGPNVQPSDLLRYREGIPDPEFRTPAYFFQMKSCQVEEGRLARFDCRVVAYPKPDIVWMKDGKVVTSGERYKLLNFNDEIYSLLIQNVESEDDGRYTCWAHNKYGEAMTEAYLNVIALQDEQEEGDMAPKFLTRFYDQTMTEGVPTEFACKITGKPEPSVMWLFNNARLVASSEIQMFYVDGNVSLKISEVKQKHVGKYKCLLENPLGEATCVAGLTVVDKKIRGVPMLPKFLKKLADSTTKTGEEHTFEVVVVGEPKPKITWMFNHKAVSTSHRRMRRSHEGDVYRLTISDARLEDDGKYTVKAANSEGEVYCSCSLLVKETRTILEPVEDVSFKQKDFDAKYGCVPTFMKKPEDVTTLDGSTAKFECRVMGIPEPKVIWTKDGRELVPSKKFWITQDNQGNCSLQIYNVTPNDVGTYSCIAKNAAGEVLGAAMLKIGKAKDSIDREQPSVGRKMSLETSLDKGTLPIMPRDEPKLYDVRPDSVRLSWASASIPSQPSEARNIRYIVESRQRPDSDWTKVATGIHGNTFMVKQLRPNKEYDFRVRAENQFGASEPTQPTKLERVPIKEEIQPERVSKQASKLPEFKKPPRLPASKPLITDMGEESVRLAWKPAVPITTVKKPLPVTYRVEAQELPSSDWLPLASGLRDHSYHVPSLSTDRDYNIRVRAENKYGVSEPTDFLWLPRADKYPEVPISRPIIEELEPETVRLSWRLVDVPATNFDEEPLTFIIEMQEPPLQSWRELARNLPEPKYTVRDLRPGQDYRFRVRARSLDGRISEPSPSASLYRALAMSRAPIDTVSIEDTEPDTEGINLSWRRVNVAPYHLDDEPLLYMIEMQEVPMSDWRRVVSGIPTTRFRVSDVIPDRDYMFRVRALSTYGLSPPSHSLPVSYRRPLPGPSAPLRDYTPRLLYDDTEALSLAWTPPVIDSPRPIRYNIQLQSPPTSTWRTLASDIDDTKYRISGLGPSRDYLFRVVPHTALGPLEPLPPVPMSSLPTPRVTLPSRPEIQDLEPTSLLLSWRRPILDTSTHVTYIIEAQEPPSLYWRSLTSGLTDTQYRVTGLRPNRDYNFRVVPVTRSGQMEPLPPVTLTAMPVLPRMPSVEPSVSELDKDSVKLTWRPAELPFYHRRRLPVHYSIDMCTLPDYNWINVARHVPDTSYIIRGLNPARDYQFRVQAVTDYGASSPTTPVHFYRRPVPTIPRREPVVSSIAMDSISLSWSPATVPGRSNRLPLYTIEVQEPPIIGSWRPLVSNINRTTHHVTGLKPDQDYMFRVTPMCDGLSGEPTLPVYLLRRSGPPRLPREQPYLYNVQPDSVRLQWRSVELSPKCTDYSPVHYRLEIQEGPYSDWLTLAARIPRTEYHVTNLRPDIEYNFRIRAENEYGYSEPTAPVHLRRRAVAPILPTDEPMIYDVGYGALQLSWRGVETPPYSSGARPVTYTIYAQESPSTAWIPIVKRVPHTWYHVTGLKPDKDYSFKVQAENEFGSSQPTRPCRLLHAGYPAPMETPEIYDYDQKSRSLRLEWKPRDLAPFHQKPTRYHIESWEPRRRSWNRVASDITDTSYRLSGIPIDYDNLFRVRAEAERILSEPTYPVSLARYSLPPRLPVSRPQLHDLDLESVRLSWYPYHIPRYTSLPPKRYQIEMKDLVSAPADWRVVGVVPDTTYHVRNLRPRSDYKFRICGLLDDGPTGYSYPVSLYRQSALPRLPFRQPSVTAVQDEAVDLEWTLVDVPATNYDERPLTFIIEAQKLPSYDWSPVAKGVRGTTYRVPNLQRHQDYAFRVRGELPYGLSEPSPAVSVYRRPIRVGVPIARPDIFWDSDLHAARLRWHRVYTPPFHRVNLPLRYHVEVQDLPKRTWRPLAKGITMEEFNIRDLSPDRDYMFRLRAETPEGDLSEATPPIPFYRRSPAPSPSRSLALALPPVRSRDYRLMEEEFGLPTRTYFEHLTTYIPPRLPIDKPDLFEMGPDSATLSWKPARVPDKIRHKSRLTYSIEVRTPPNYEWRELVGDLTSTTYNLSDLHPKLDYMFRVRAHNEYGHSEPSLPVSLFRPIEITEDDFDYYYDDDEDDWEFRSSFVETDNWIMRYNKKEPEPSIEEAPPKLPMETPKITDHGTSAMLSWLPARIPAYAKKVPITYIIEMKQPPVPGWSRMESGIVDTSFYIEGLLANHDYQFRVKAETQFGTSDPTLAAVLDRTTGNRRRQSSLEPRRAGSVEDDLPSTVYLDSVLAGVPPRMPSSRPLISNQYGSHIQLSWLPARVPSYVKGSKLTYVVEMRRPPHTMWTTLAEGLDVYEFDVFDVDKNGDYMFRVKAKNEYGTSEPTMPVSLIRSRDDYVSPLASRRGSHDSTGSPWIRSRASSVESSYSGKRLSMDKEGTPMPTKPCAPTFKSKDDNFFGVEFRPVKITLIVRACPVPTIQWTFNGEKLSGDNFRSTVTAAGVVTLEILRMTEDVIGNYKCTAENSEGLAVRKVHLDLADPPTFLEPLREVTVDLKSKIVLSCRVEGMPYPNIKWTRDGRPLAESSRVHMINKEPYSVTLEIDSAMAMDAGMYMCIAENVAGKSMSSARVNISEEETDEEDRLLLNHTRSLFREAYVEDFYYILEELGRGRHGVVRRVIEKSTGKHYAAKFITVSSVEHKEFFMREFKTLCSLEHKNILGVNEAFMTGRRIIIITELLTGGEFLDRILAMDDLTESDVGFFIGEVLQALKYLHSCDFVHLDVKLANIHFASKDSEELKLIDFGFARHLSADLTCNHGTPEYVSPEQVRKEVITPATDIWSLGVMTYILLSGISPFAASSDKGSLEKILDCDWTFDEELFENVSKEAKDFISKILISNPSERLTTEACLEHPWIKSFSSNGSNVDMDQLDLFLEDEKKRKKKIAVRTCAKLQSLSSILNKAIDDDLQTTEQDGKFSFPDANKYGQFLDEESWHEWQIRYHQDNRLPSHDDVSDRLQTYRAKLHEDGKEVDYFSTNPCIVKELEWSLVEGEFKPRAKDDMDDYETLAQQPIFTRKLQDVTFAEGDRMTLTCTFNSTTKVKVTWYHNEERVTEGSRMKTEISDEGVTTLTILTCRPYDEGVYKCTIRNSDGQTTCYARVTIAGVPEPPGRAASVKVSDTQALIIWGASASNDAIKYRVDYRNTGDERWKEVATVIDEWCLVSNLVKGNGYRFRVCAINKAGASPYSVASAEIKTATTEGTLKLDKLISSLLERQNDISVPVCDKAGDITVVESSPFDSYESISTIYSGEFSKLECCKCIQRKSVFAIKSFKSFGSSAEDLHEYNILKELDHHRIISLYGANVSDGYIYLVLEFLTGVNIVEHLSFKSVYSEDAVAMVIKQVLDGVEYLHYKNVIHLNLQPSSVVVAGRKDVDIRIVDFALAQRFSEGKDLIVLNDSHPEFTAPEVIKGEAVYYTTDIWTVGVLAFLLLSGESPFVGRTRKEVFSNVVYNRHDAHGLFDNVSKEAQKFLFQVLRCLPRNRLGVTKCLEHKWFQTTEVATKGRKERVFSAAKLRTFTEKYMQGRTRHSPPETMEILKEFATKDRTDTSHIEESEKMDSPESSDVASKDTTQEEVSDDVVKTGQTGETSDSQVTVEDAVETSESIPESVEDNLSPEV